MYEDRKQRTSIHAVTFSRGCQIWSPSSAKRSTTALLCDESFLTTRAAGYDSFMYSCPFESENTCLMHLRLRCSPHNPCFKLPSRCLHNRSKGDGIRLIYRCLPHLVCRVLQFVKTLWPSYSTTEVIYLCNIALVHPRRTQIQEPTRFCQSEPCTGYCSSCLHQELSSDQRLAGLTHELLRQPGLVAATLVLSTGLHEESQSDLFDVQNTSTYTM